MSNTIAFEISRLPLSIVVGAYNAFVPSPVSGITKPDAVKALAQRVENGGLTLDQIKGANPASPLPKGATVDPTVMTRIDASANVANQAHNVALDAFKQAAETATTVSKLVKTAILHNDKLTAIAEKLDTFTVDDDRLAAEVNRSIAEAFKPFKTAVDNAGMQTVIADLSSVHITETVPTGEAFGVSVFDSKNKELTVTKWNHPDAPAIDPDFIWTEEILKHLLLSDMTGENLWFGGEKGTGKSETARQFAARTGRAFKRINFHKHTSTEEYLGAVGLVDGATVFQPKDFLMAYTTPSTVILLDEITNADAGELAPLNGFLEPNAAVNFGGQRWSKAQGVMVFAADNTFGSGDDSGRHAGTRLQNSALIDRFSRVIPFTFLPADDEIKAIMSRTGCNRYLAKHVHDAVVVCRQKANQGEIVDSPSIRSVIAFIRALSVLDARQAWSTAVVARQPSEGHAVLWSVFASCIDPSLLADNL